MATIKEVDFDPFAGSPVGKALPFDRNAALADTDKALSLPAGFSAAQIQVESGGNPKARSSAGAMGLAQVMPDTLAVVSKRLGRELDPDNEKDAVDIHREVMRENLAKFKDPAKALMAYNGGWNPDKWGNPETAAYVGKVQAAMKSGKNPIMATAEKVANAVIPSAQAAQAPQAIQESTLHEVDFDPFAQTAPPAPPKRSMIDELGHQLGLTLRAGVTGAASIPAMVSDAVTGPINAGIDKVAGVGNGFRFQPVSQALGNVMTRAGVAAPENAMERVVQDTASSVSGAGSMIKGGLGLAKYAGGPVAKGLGEILASGPRLQLASAATGAGASGVTRESGGGTGAQLAAGLAGALAPGFVPAAAKATVRGALRGGESGRQQVEKNIAIFENASGDMPTLGQATESRFSRGLESVLSKSPGGAGVMVRKAEEQLQAMGKSVQTISDELAPGASAINAGEAISKGIKGFKDGFKGIQQRLYSTLDTHIPSGTPIQVGNTEFKLKELNEGIEGAPNISQFFMNSKIKGIDKALQADLELSVSGGSLPYEAVKKLRTLVGNEIADNSLLADVPRSKWAALYGALSDDLGVAAKNAGPDAEQSWKWANQFNKKQLGRLEELSGIVAKDTPEQVFAKATAGTAEGDTVVKRVISALPKQARREVAAAMLQRMGRATPGVQDATGGAFSSETFLTNLSKLSPAARETLFARTGNSGLLAKVTAMGKMAGNIRSGSKVFSNPSGTAQALTLKDMVYAAVGGLLTGSPSATALAIGAPTVANMAAKFNTSPSVVKFAAGQTALRDGVKAAAVGAATRINSVTPPPIPKTFSFEDAQFADPVQQPVPDPVRVELNGMAQPDVEQPEVDPAQELDAEDAPLAPDAPQSAAEIDPAQAFTSEPRPDGALAIKGNPQALHSALVAAGIPAQSIIQNKTGVMVGRTQAAQVQQAIDRLHAAAAAPQMTADAAPSYAQPEPMADAAPTGGQINPQEFASNQAPAPEEYAHSAINAGMESQPADTVTSVDSPSQAEAPAVAMSESAQSEPVSRIQRLRDSGEHKVADLLQRSQDRNKTMGDVQNELSSMQAANPDLPHHGSPTFNDHYQQQRLAGSKPAEASAHAGMLHAVKLAAPKIGMPEAAVKALTAKLQDIPIDEAPAFVERFTKALIGNGMIQPFEGSNQVASALENARDAAMHGALDSLYEANQAS